MASLSNYLENELLDHALGTGSFTAPSNVYMALFTSDPTDAGSGTEVSGAGYARQLVTFGAASSGSVTNSSAEVFTASGGTFGTVTHTALYDASTSGNLLFHGALATAKTVTDGESLTIAIGAFTIALA